MDDFSLIRIEGILIERKNKQVKWKCGRMRKMNEMNKEKSKECGGYTRATALPDLSRLLSGLYPLSTKVPTKTIPYLKIKY